MRKLGTHTTKLRVRLKEVAFDHVYFGTAFTWFEVGRGNFSRAVGAPYAKLEERGLGSFVTAAAARYRRPIPPTGVVRLETSVASVTRSRFSFVYKLFAGDADQPAVTGQSDHVMADLDGQLRRIPDDFASAMRPVGARTERVNLGGPRTVGWTHRLRARYEETDAFRVVYHGNYFAWMEAAWSGQLADGPWDLARAMPEGRAFPVLTTQCQYLAPARYDDEVIIEVGATPVGRTRVQLDYRFSRGDATGSAGPTLALGRTVHAVTLGRRVVPVPADLLEALGVSAVSPARSIPAPPSESRRGDAPA